MTAYLTVGPTLVPATRTYEEFLAGKLVETPDRGFQVLPEEVNPLVLPHQRDVIIWAVRKGCAGIFLAFGLGKSIIQIECVRLIQAKIGGRVLVVVPLGVRQEFRRDGLLDTKEFRDRAEALGLDHAALVREYGVRFKFIQSDTEIDSEEGFYLTNYESVREGKVTPALFKACGSLDEAAVLRHRGTKTFGEFTFKLFAEVQYKFVATATPDPNEYQELLSYAAFLGVGDISQMRTRFFKRDSTKMDNLTLHPHMEREWWLWVSDWAVFLQRPSDLGYSDEGYILPELEIHWHEVPTDHRFAGSEKSGQRRLISSNSAIDMRNAAKEKRASLPHRLNKLMELREIDPGAHRIIWHDLEDERIAIEKAIPTAVTIYGKQDVDRREQMLVDFSNGLIQELAPKTVICGCGGNYQRYCHWAIFLSISFKFHDFIQGVHRLLRFLQPNPVRLDMIYSEAERGVRQALQDKWDRYKVQVAKMAEIIREYGLARNAMRAELKRSASVERREAKGERYTVANDDAVYYTRSLQDDSVGLICTSIPFSTQYEYSPSLLDFGHTEDNEHFFEQMSYLTPELLRVLKPGRVAAVHVKDRIVPSGMTALGFQTAYPFHCDVIRHFMERGFAFLGMKTVVTDVVRENNQTYRLGWTEQCKDGSRMGAGLPEYVLLFRKPPTDRSDGYADDPVLKEKSFYTRSRWQIDAHGFSRSNGNRFLSTAELTELATQTQGQRWGVIYRMFRKYSYSNVYDFEGHVKLSESLEEAGRLPSDFMLLPPQSWHPDVWTDITRMRTLNGAQSAAGRVMHVCPLQFDITDRIIQQFSMKGEVVYDPFAGVGTVPYRAILLERYGLGCELSTPYWQDGIGYCRAAEQQVGMPTLFDLIEAESEPEEIDESLQLKGAD